MSDNINVEKIFGQNVFTMRKMRKVLPPDVLEEVEQVIYHGGELSAASADAVAYAMKQWAIENGATHYTHWFQPLTGITAEKHDAFVSKPDDNGKMITSFTGKMLIRGEPDASSFPSGGLRATFEARGYTAWDITSPAFLKETAAGVTLCIPTAFCSYTGEALDKKTPLLRSMEAVSEQALRIVRLFHNERASRVNVSVGPEQEYFLVDWEMSQLRQDLIFTGRTLFGAAPPKGQEMEDHYFGVIRERAGAFMKDLNEELWKLGVPGRTQHKEVAPGQHELAVIYETANIAVDHNQIVMETMKRVAEYHGMRCLLHEKPFDGVNGSGKHVNWSLSTDDGVNLLEPGEAPGENLQFLLVLACMLKAVDEHADMLRQSASDVGNDLRLGAHEAPPAIISVFLGAQLDDVVRQIIETGEAASSIHGGTLKTGVSTLPDLELDATDRNRTSPFAFTGNKFEFRMVGSADSVASPVTTMNAIFAEAFSDAADEIEGAADREAAIRDVIKKNLTEHQRIIFNGNGYADEWVKEAARLGLPNIPTMIEAADVLTQPKTVASYEKFGIFTASELSSRQEIIYETYVKTINIEALTMLDMAKKQILPAVMHYAGRLAHGVKDLKTVGVDASVETAALKEIQKHLKTLQKALDKLERDEARSAQIESVRERAFYYKDRVKPDMLTLRQAADALELLLDKKMWPFPTYADLMFSVE